MSIENSVDLNRKFNSDYTIIMDDEKIAAGEKLQANLFVENFMSKRDKSPSTCHNNVDTSNETSDTMRANILDKKLENNHAISVESNGKRQKTVCYDFKKGICRRRFCRVSRNGAYALHGIAILNADNFQYPHVMNADQVIFCHDFQNNGCFRANCRFVFHKKNHVAQTGNI